MTSIQVKQLSIYPVKSLAGINVKQSTLLSSGLPYDRYWLIVDENNNFLTQRQLPIMTLINTALSDNKLILSFKGEQLEIEISKQPQGPVFESKVWQDACQVVDEGEAAHAWLSKILGQPVRLVRMADSFTRSQSKADIYGNETHTYFADAAPYLLCNQDSITHLNEQLAQEGSAPVQAINFRSNILIEGLEAFAEHKVKDLSNGNYTLSCVFPCQRCGIPNIDPVSTLKRKDSQPYNILSQINPMPGSLSDTNPKKGKPAFGENVILKSGEESIIRVGDTLTTN